jgi:hypothetical protein
MTILRGDTLRLWAVWHGSRSMVCSWSQSGAVAVRGRKFCRATSGYLTADESLAKRTCGSPGKSRRWAKPTPKMLRPSMDGRHCYPGQLIPTRMPGRCARMRLCSCHDGTRHVHRHQVRAESRLEAAGKIATQPTSDGGTLATVTGGHGRNTGFHSTLSTPAEAKMVNARVKEGSDHQDCVRRWRLLRTRCRR